MMNLHRGSVTQLPGDPGVVKTFSRAAREEEEVKSFNLHLC